MLQWLLLAVFQLLSSNLVLLRHLGASEETLLLNYCYFVVAFGKRQSSLSTKRNWECSGKKE